MRDLRTGTVTRRDALGATAAVIGREVSPAHAGELKAFHDRCLRTAGYLLVDAPAGCIIEEA